MNNIVSLYNEVINYVLAEGKVIAGKCGVIPDIGVTKKYVTEEDIRIERELKSIIQSFDSSHEIYAEEENNDWKESKNVWVIDPISGTRTFVKGIPHYGMVVSHVLNGKPQFAVVYDPSIDELFKVTRGGGAFLNDKQIHMNNDDNEFKSIRLILNMTHKQLGNNLSKEMIMKLSGSNLFRNSNSFAVNYCWVACGRYDGVIALTKDSFPEVAGSLFIQEAGGIFTNINGNKEIGPDDNFFVGGNQQSYAQLFELVKDLNK